jgi:hypothetical protein
MGMRSVSVSVFLFLGISVSSAADPLLTIACEKPKGTRIEYGISPIDRMKAAMDNQSQPTNNVFKQGNDAYVFKPTIIINDTKELATIVWSTDDIKADGPPPPSTEMPIIAFSDDQITAAEIWVWGATTYSFFPKLGVTFFSEQHPSLGLQSAIQTAFFAHCDFTWSNLEKYKRK